ncbi:MAG TPA: ABC transporter ATP-binding protein/permease [Acholeplasmataceae bacterium]|nr:ABC transporter ATP-binding protein/permease [Acholeplasmataceae bacterium]
MLEIKNLTKTYVPKKGVPVVALNRVNLKIEDKGLVFILGKSGSGKSTLLNLLGGLDKYDEGDIIIKGKSTKDFTQGNFDSYRNTYVGFIFQEYNILEEFTVGANIALAIELQGRKASNEEVSKILDTLDLAGYGNRRPNELSGGQRQRVAIARALVKNPDIILADEPTGALDSKTGLQIFDILKKLSQEKLVLVVSHDREFAETYGDRVIELADGKIISDISKKTLSNGATDSPNIQFVENEGLVVREGYKLTPRDLEMINNYLEKEKQLNIISKNEVEFQTREVFVETENIDLKSYAGAFTMIKSRLPSKMAFRMGASGLKHKKFRLFFTILLSLVAFTLFGVADSLAAYNKIDATVNSIIDGEIDAIAFSKSKTMEIDNYKRTIDLTLSKEDIDGLNESIGKELGLNFKPVYTGGSEDYSGAFRIDTNFSQSIIRDYDMYYLDSISGFAEFTKQELEELGFTVHGKMPNADDEIAVTDYIFEHFTKKGYSYYDDKNELKDFKPDSFKTYTDLIGKTLILRNYSTSQELTFKVTGIIDTNFVSTRYESLKTSFGDNYFLIQEFRTVIQYGYHALGFVNIGLIDKLIENLNQNVVIRNNAHLGYYNQQVGYYAEYVDKLDNFEKENIIFFNKNKTALAENEIIVDADSFRWSYQNEITYGGFTGRIDDHLYRISEQIIREYAEENYLEAEAKGFFLKRFGEDGNDYPEENKINEYALYLISEGYIENIYGEKTGFELEMESYSHLAPVFQQIEDIEVQKEYHNYIIGDSDYSLAKVVGVFLTTNFDTPSLIIVDDEFYAELETLGRQEPYKFAIAKMPDQRNKIHKIAEFSYQMEDSISYPLKNSATPMLEMANDLVENVAHVFVYIGMAFAVFSALMLSNFIASSVNLKRREIGILRAIGARSNDVFQIFFNEAIIIAIINFFLASISTFIVVRLINNSLRSDVGLTVTVFNLSIRQIVILLFISIFVALAASFLPVYRIARKKPVDAISNK